MITFFDASALVKLYIQEEGSDEVRARSRRRVVVVSRLSEAEVTSALARRCRQGELSAEVRNTVLASLADDLETFLVVELTPEVVAKACELLKRNDLRAADALQLASCLHFQDDVGQPVECFAFDGHLRQAAESEGLVLA